MQPVWQQLVWQEARCGEQNYDGNSQQGTASPAVGKQAEEGQAASHKAQPCAASKGDQQTGDL